MQFGTPPRLYNGIVRVVADKKANGPAENARLFALVNAAMGETGIVAWKEKYRHNLWRPVLGIREYDLRPARAPAGAANPASAATRSGRCLVVAAVWFWLLFGYGCCRPEEHTSELKSLMRT